MPPQGSWSWGRAHVAGVCLGSPCKHCAGCRLTLPLSVGMWVFPPLQDFLVCHSLPSRAVRELGRAQGPRQGSTPASVLPSLPCVPDPIQLLCHRSPDLNGFHGEAGFPPSGVQCRLPHSALQGTAPSTREVGGPLGQARFLPTHPALARAQPYSCQGKCSWTVCPRRTGNGLVTRALTPPPPSSGPGSVPQRGRGERRQERTRGPDFSSLLITVFTVNTVAFEKPRLLRFQRLAGVA